MKNGNGPCPSFWHRISSVWYRHMKVYTKNIVTNGFPPFLEPLIFLFGIGLGLGNYVSTMEGVPYIQFLSLGLILTSAMFTAAFECTYGTYVRLEFEKVYDGMLGAPLTATDLLLGEILWCGTKGLFFATAVLTVISIFGILPIKLFLIVPIIGFLTGIMFAALSLLVTSFVNDINQFNFYSTGFISPMFFFSGVVFSLGSLPPILRIIAELLPLTHTVRLLRMLSVLQLNSMVLVDIGYIVIFTVVMSYLAIRQLKKRLIS
ncbi:MAG TPA: ABC transporter [Candidatus Margulisbacteria bacterium]|nr:MAG: ABC transporter [Candidatus Margulisbacteria bacterium GWE2_39_32]HCT85237.1 ABC transporter [Candidatus Margulisiibacteriota bacterium]